MSVVKVKSLDHFVLKVKDQKASLDFYVNILGLTPERVELWQAGKVGFPSVRLNAFMIIDFFKQSDSGDLATKNNVDHICLEVEPMDLDLLKTQLEGLNVSVVEGPGTRWGAKGIGMVLCIQDPDQNVIELRYYE